MPERTDKNNCYSKERLNKFRETYGDLRYSVYCELRELGVTHAEIAKMYGMTGPTLYRFTKPHQEVVNK